MSTVIRPQIGIISRCFSDLFTYAVLFGKTCTQKQPEFTEVQSRVKNLLAQSAKCSTDNAVDPRDYDDARFAVCAWLDEMMMNSPWTERGQWQRALLQSDLYGTSNAGEDFFERLNRLGNRQNHIREVYFICLSLGFMGRYCHAGDEILLGQLRLSNINALLGTRGSMDNYSREPMFNCAYESLGKDRQGGLPIKKISSLFSSNLFVIAIPTLIIIGIYIIFNFVLDGVKDSLLIHLIGE